MVTILTVDREGKHVEGQAFAKSIKIKRRANCLPMSTRKTIRLSGQLCLKYGKVCYVLLSKVFSLILYADE